MTPLCMSGKIIYTSKKLASVSLDMVCKRPMTEKERLQVYHCERCGGFHLGRKLKNKIDKPKKKKMNARRVFEIDESYQALDSI